MDALRSSDDSAVEAFEKEGMLSRSRPGGQQHRPDAQSTAASSNDSNQPHEADSCYPCVFFASPAGCRREACPYCHIHRDKLEANPQRPGKQIRMRLKRSGSTEGSESMNRLVI